MSTRRRFLSLIAVSSLAPARGRAQQPNRVPRVGILSPGAPIFFAGGSDAQLFTVCLLMDGLRALGYIDGRNIAFEYRFADGDYKRLPTLAMELAGLRPAVIYTHTGLSAD